MMALFSKAGRAEGPARVTRIKGNPAKAYDELERLVDEAQWGSSNEAKQKAVAKVMDNLSVIDDIGFLHAMYEKQPYKNEAAKQLVVQRFFALLGDMRDADALLALHKKGYTHNFSNNISLHIEIVVSDLEDEATLRRIRQKESGFDFRAQAMAELMLTHAEMGEEKLLRIAQGQESVNGNRSVALMSKAVSYLDDEEALTALAFDMHNSFDAVIQAQLKLIQVTEDPALLNKIKEQANHFTSYEEYAPIVPVIRERVDRRIAAL